MPSLLLVANVAEMFRDFLLPYAEYFRARGWQVDAMGNGVSRSKECAGVFDRALEIDWSRNPLCPSNFMQAPGQIRREVEAANYDLVHAHTPVAGFIARLALHGRSRNHPKNPRPKIIYTAHGFHFHPAGSAVKNFLYRRLEKLAGHWTDYLVVINRTDEMAARKYRLVPPHKLVYMPGIGIDLEHYARESVSISDVRSVRNELGIPPERQMFLMIAEFTPGKRHRDAVHALAALGDVPVDLVFAGEGPLMDQIRRLTSELNLAHRVHFLGYRKDIPRLIRASMATLLPSEREGLPRSIMESLSLGIPVIATNVRGCRDLLEGGGGILVPVGDPRGLSQAMRWVLAAPERAARMGAMGMRSLQSHDIQRVLSLHDALYHQALSGARPNEQAT